MSFDRVSFPPQPESPIKLLTIVCSTKLHFISWSKHIWNLSLRIRDRIRLCFPLSPQPSHIKSQDLHDGGFVWSLFDLASSSLSPICLIHGTISESSSSHTFSTTVLSWFKTAFTLHLLISKSLIELYIARADPPKNWMLGEDEDIAFLDGQERLREIDCDWSRRRLVLNLAPGNVLEKSPSEILYQSH